MSVGLRLDEVLSRQARTRHPRCLTACPDNSKAWLCSSELRLRINIRPPPNFDNAICSAFAGSGPTDLVDAVLNVEVDDDLAVDLFGAEEDAPPKSPSIIVEHEVDAPALGQRGRYQSTTSLTPSTPTRSNRSRSRQPGLEATLLSNPSPLARAYSHQYPPPVLAAPPPPPTTQRLLDKRGDELLAGLKRVEEALKAGEGLKEMGERQERIEALLMSLTRGMRS